MPFKIKCTKRVTVRDLNGDVLQVVEVGDVLEATCDAGVYWISCPPLFKDEAELVPEEHVSDHAFYD